MTGLKRRCTTGLVLTLAFAFAGGALSGRAAAADDHRGGERHDRDRGRHYGGGYYRAPPVVYGPSPYYAPPLVYGPAPGLNINIR